MQGLLYPLLLPCSLGLGHCQELVGLLEWHRPEMMGLGDVPGLICLGGLEQTLGLFVYVSSSQSFFFAFLSCFPLLVSEKGRRGAGLATSKGMIRLIAEWAWHRAASGEASWGLCLFSASCSWWQCWESHGNEPSSARPTRPVKARVLMLASTFAVYLCTLMPNLCVLPRL